MDKETRGNIEKIAQAQRLADEEQMRAENIAGIIEANEDLDDHEDLIKKLRRQLKTWTGIFVSGVIALIIILLYMVYTVISFMHAAPDDVPEISEPVTEEVIEVEPEVNQDIIEASLYYKLECPAIDKSEIKTSSFKGVAKKHADWYSCNYLGKVYDNVQFPDAINFYEVKINEEPVPAPKDKIYFLDSVKDLMLSQPRVYTSSTEDFDVPDYSKLNESTDKERDLDFGAFAPDGREAVCFYSAKTVSDVSEDRLADIITPLEYKVVIYDDVNVDGVDAAIKEAFSNGTYQKSKDMLIANDKSEIVDAIKTVTDKFEITCTSNSYVDCMELLYNYYDSVETEDGKIICTKDGNEVVPDKVINLYIKDYEIMYNELACAYYYGWY